MDPGKHHITVSAEDTPLRPRFVQWLLRNRTRWDYSVQYKPYVLHVPGKTAGVALHATLHGTERRRRCTARVRKRTARASTCSAP